MTKKLLSLALIAIMLAMLIPSAALASWTMYVYTDDGLSLNVRSEPMMGDNKIGSIKYAGSVSVRMTMSNGWACIDWPRALGGVAYVQSRFLINYEPAAKPKKQTSSTTTSTVKALEEEFKSAKQVSPFTVTVRPARASGFVTMHWAPSTDMPKIATYAQGRELVVLAQLKNWYQVEDPDTGNVGFVSTRLVQRLTN